MASQSLIEEQASEWIARRDGSDWSEADQAQLTLWLERSTAHMVEFLRLEAMWQHSSRLKAFGAGWPSGAAPGPGDLQASPYFAAHLARRGETHAAQAKSAGHRPWFVPAAAAAVVALVALAFAWHAGLLDRTRYSTPVGGLAYVPMSDGSKVLMNTDSNIQLDVSETQRRVDLQRGEAFFEVARDPTRPFVVIAADKRIVAVGTKFSVRRDGKDVQVIVTEGRVRVEQSRGGQAKPIAELAAGNVARARNTGVLVQKRPLPEVEELLSWRSGFVVFHETRLADAVAEFNRYNDRQIVLEDPSVADIRIGGKFRSTSIESFVGLLEAGFPVRAAASDERIVLIGK